MCASLLVLSILHLVSICGGRQRWGTKNRPAVIVPDRLSGDCGAMYPKENRRWVKK